MTSIVVNENGPARIFARVRERAGVYQSGEQSSWAELFSCVWCMSVWVAPAVVFTFAVAPVVAYSFAASSLAIMLDKVSARKL